MAPTRRRDDARRGLGLEFGNQVLVLKAARRLAASGLGVVLSTHDPDHAFARASRVHLLAEGATRAVGARREVLTPEVPTRTYGLPVAVEQLVDGHPVCVVAKDLLQ
jgi:iron complex transport system ATP-binding protein